MAGKLILMFHGQVLGEYPLDKEVITIGRKPNNDIQIDNLAVSGQHCKVTTVLNDSFLEDLGSTNGTLVNGKRISRHALQNGDLIEVVKHQLKYVNDGAATGEEEFEKTMVFRPGMLGAEPQEMPAVQAAREMGVSRPAATTPPPPPPTSAPETRQGALRVANGPNAGKELILTKALTSLGKPGVQVAAIHRRSDGYHLKHVEGKVPPKLNGQPMGGEQRLKDRDLIDLDGIQVEFFFKG